MISYEAKNLHWTSKRLVLTIQLGIEVPETSFTYKEDIMSRNYEIQQVQNSLLPDSIHFHYVGT